MLSYSRDGFKNRLQEVIGGALGEFYKAECATANGLTKWVKHWTNEAQRQLAFMVTQVYLHPIKFKDRRKALAEALQEMRRVDAGYRNFAMNRVVRDYRLTKLKHRIPPSATDRFYELVEACIQDAEGEPTMEEIATSRTIRDDEVLRLRHAALKVEAIRLVFSSAKMLFNAGR